MVIYDNETKIDICNTVKIPLGATHFNVYKGKISQFYKTENNILLYYSIFNTWKKSNNTEMVLFKINIKNEQNESI